MTISDTEHRKNRKQFFIYLFLFVCILIIGFYVKEKGKRENIEIDKNGCVTIGQIYYTRNSTRGLWVKYSFNIEGQQYKGVLRTYKEGIEIGKQYEVEYLPDNPEINRINFDRKISTDK